MAKPSDIISSQIKNISRKDLEKLVLKAAARDKAFHDYLLVNYFDKEFGEQDLFEQAKADLDLLFKKYYKGFAQEQKLANMLMACSKRIAAFAKVCRQKNLEADLVMYVLEIPFTLPLNLFGTCFTSYDYRVGLLVKKMIGLLNNKLHEDFELEYKTKINSYLKILHRVSGHVGTIYVLPKEI
ncbi:MAG: hypothetical protein ABIU30_08795 [Ferruginibacter sp.]